jgi:hypothetical protein
MSDVTAQVRTVREVLDQVFRLGDYQRDFVWDAPQIDQLLRDLKGAFEPPIGPAKGYFLGPIITKPTKSHGFLIDGQQRLTTLALLLVALRRRLQNTNKSIQNQIIVLIERRLRDGPVTSIFENHAHSAAIVALNAQGALPGPPSTDSERAIAAAYQRIEAFVADRLESDHLVPFAQWLLDKVSLAEIRAGESHDAFALFQSMNSKGKPLDALEHFSTYLGGRITDIEARNEALAVWREGRERVARHGQGAAVQCLKSIAAARLSTFPAPVPERSAEARKALENSVLSQIDGQGPMFLSRHAEDTPALGLSDAREWINRHWRIQAAIFDQAHNARRDVDPVLEGMRFLERIGFESGLYEDALLIAAATPGDPNWQARVQISLQFLENIAARWAWTAPLKSCPGRNIERVKYAMARAIGMVRDADVKAMADRLAKLQTELIFSFSANPEFGRPYRGSSTVAHAVLARLSAFMDQLDGRADTYRLYENRDGASGYDVEHFLPRRFTADGSGGHNYRNAKDYRHARERLGALALLPRSLNQSLGDKSFGDKRRIYADQACNALARSVMGSAALSPPLRRALDAKGIVFEDMSVIDRRTLQARQAAMVKLAEWVWGGERLAAIAAAV